MSKLWRPLVIRLERNGESMLDFVAKLAVKCCEVFNELDLAPGEILFVDQLSAHNIAQRTYMVFTDKELAIKEKPKASLREQPVSAASTSSSESHGTEAAISLLLSIGG